MSYALTAHVIPSGTYLPMTSQGRTRRVPEGHLGVWCELCEYAVTVPLRMGHEHAEALRRQHLGTAHLSALTAGAAVMDQDLRHVGARR